MVAGAVVATALAAVLAGGVAALTVSGSPAMRVLLIGDSLTADAASDIRAVLGTARRPPRLRVAAVPGSGLLSGFDWRPETARLVAAEHPDVVVFEFVGNYFAPYATAPDGRTVPPRSDSFFAMWAARAAALTATARRSGATVEWVLPPPMADPTADAVAVRLADGYRRLAMETAGVSVVDERTPFGGVGTCYRAEAWVGGRWCTVRRSDGVHLTAAGNRLWAEVLARALDRRHRLGIPAGGSAPTSAAGRVAVEVS